MMQILHLQQEPQNESNKFYQNISQVIITYLDLTFISGKFNNEPQFNKFNQKKIITKNVIIH